MKGSDHDEGADAPEPVSGSPKADRWKAMPDGDAKRAAYLEQARELELRSRSTNAAPTRR